MSRRGGLGNVTHSGLLNGFFANKYPCKRAKRASLGRHSFARKLVGKKSVLDADRWKLHLCPALPVGFIILATSHCVLLTSPI